VTAIGMVAGLLSLAPLPAHAAQPLYGTAAHYPVGSQPRSVATVDTDGDGAPDLVSADFGARTISVLPGLGDGSFGPATAIPLEGSPTSVSIGDFDHDLDADLAVTVFATPPGAPAVLVLRGSAGASFAPPVSYPLEQNPLGGAVSDVDLDGSPDVVAIDAFGVSVLRGAPTGALGPATRLAVGTFLANVAVGDFNHDSDPDLALGQFVGEVLVLLGGAGASFGPPTSFNAGLTPASPAVDDLNGDGHLDLVASDFSAPTVSVLLGAGDGRFAPATGYGTGAVDGMATHVLVDRLDGDSHPDVAVTNSSTGDVSVLLNLGDGTFGAAVSYPVGANPFASAVAELNLDGGGDLVFADAGGSQVSVLLSNLPNRPPECGTVTAAPNRLWPPNHRMRRVRLTGAHDPDGDDLTTVVTGVTQDEPVGARPTAILADPLLLRAERDPRGDGRVYRVSFTVTDPHGASCSGVAAVGVPRDHRRIAVDSGGAFDSLAPGKRPRGPGRRP
jgi:hypothetical protein